MIYGLPLVTILNVLLCSCLFSLLLSVLVHGNTLLLTFTTTTITTRFTWMVFGIGWWRVQFRHCIVSYSSATISGHGATECYNINIIGMPGEYQDYADKAWGSSGTHQAVNTAWVAGYGNAFRHLGWTWQLLSPLYLSFTICICYPYNILLTFSMTTCNPGECVSKTLRSSLDRYYENI